jgi:hypothetical protein
MRPQVCDGLLPGGREPHHVPTRQGPDHVASAMHGTHGDFARRHRHRR